MKRIGFWIQRHWLALAIAGSGILIIAWAGWQGYRYSQAQRAATIVAPPTVAVGRGEVIHSVTAPGLAISTKTQILSSRVDGRIGEILVQAGQAVQAGEVLVRIDDGENFAAAVSAARLAVLQAQQSLDDLGANAPQAIAQRQQAVEEAQQALDSLSQTAAGERSRAQLDLAEAQEALKQAQRKREKMNYPHSTDKLIIEKGETDYLLAKQVYKDALREYNQWSKKKLTRPERVQALNELVTARQDMDTKFAIYNWFLLNYSGNDIAQADSELAVAKASLEKAQADWDRLKDGTRSSIVAMAEATLAGAQREWERVKGGSEPIEVEIAKAALAQAQSNQTKAMADQESLEIGAPFEGIVLDITVKEGEVVSPGSALVTLLDPKAIQVRATVVEEDLPLVQPGQPVELLFDALPDANVTGTLDRIVPQRASDTQAIYPVYITLDLVPAHLAAGMTVDASVVIAERPNVLRLPRAVVHAHSDGTAEVDVWLNGQVEHRAIQVGLRGDSFVEITGGLAEGEAVVAQ